LFLVHLLPAVSDFSIADVARLSGAPKRSIQYWALSRVIETLPESDHAGTGKRRQFSRDEVIIACVVKSLSDKGLQIGRLTFIADGFRNAILRNKLLRQRIEDAIAGDDRVFLSNTEGHVILLSEKLTGIRDFFELFEDISEDKPNVDVLFLNGCFKNLRLEWNRE
jgi:DNA-binding transcriptional MerR regulator